MEVLIDREFKIPSGTPQQRKTGGKKNYASPSLQYARAAWQALLEKHIPEKPLSGPVYLEVNLYYHRKVKNGKTHYKTTRPDGDNLLKLIKDIMTKLKYWENDDSYVASEHITRYIHGGKESVTIYCKSLTEPEDDWWGDGR